jgi:predicted ATP-binding protein involved in virulence
MRIERILLQGVGPFDDVTIELPAGTRPDLADVYLLTGPNGSGKSTVLYALAAMIAAGVQELGNDLLSPRMRSEKAMAAFRTIDGRDFVAVYPPDLSAGSVPSNPFDPRRALIHRKGGKDLHHYASDGGAQRHAEMASTFRHRTFAWAAFAYSGIRQVSEVHITAIQEPKLSPFANSLSFRNTADTDLLANWIVSQNYRRLMAKEAGDMEEAERLDRSVRRIEEIIADIVEDPSFGFVITQKDNDVRVRWQGVTVRLGVLPDGLQAIVSWIADLLMRLDRIPWQDDTPVEQRPFLLLLDEIDIHLHPAWQRRVLPLVQRLFPNAQIIATTHSPFVVGSLADGRVISLGLQGSSARVIHEAEPQIGVSYSAVLRSIFGIESEFDVDTEHKLQAFHKTQHRLLAGDDSARSEVDRIAEELAQRSEELREIIALERAQLRRQLERRAAP